MQPNRWIMVGAIMGAVGVAIGAFGAHGLEKRLENQREARGWNDPITLRKEVDRRVAIYETAVRYQMFHAPALIVVGLLGFQRRSKSLTAAGWLFLMGVLVFSGLLYVLVFAGDQWKFLGAIVPIGGTALIAGWVMLAIAGAGYCPSNAASAKNQPPADT
jgi:uncharacterized membrane protein YgdD (TMEM256/DUF423 family)